MDLYHNLLAPIPIHILGGEYGATSWMEILAVLMTIGSVFGAVKLKIAQYPIGILATILYSFVFIDAKLYSSLALNIYFTVIQLYGWYFWSFGGTKVTSKATLALREPPIGNWSWMTIAPWGCAAIVASGITSYFVAKYLNGSSALLDAGILSASILAQFLLDRKQLKSWNIWMVCNVLSVTVYGFQQHLVVSGILYAVLLINAFYGLTVWKREYNAQAAA